MKPDQRCSGHQTTTLALAFLTSLLAICGGCENAGQGALSGAGIGAVSGLAIGSMTGSAGKGAAIGAIAGGVGGAVIGDQNRRRNEEAAAAQKAPPPPPPPQPAPVIVTSPPQTIVIQHKSYNTGTPLGNLVGKWNVSGTMTDDTGKPVPVNGTANAVIDKVYFVRTDLRFTDPRNGQAVDGTSIISQTGDRGLEMINSFSSFPEARHFKGSMDASGTILNFTQTDSGSKSRKVAFRISNTPGFTVDVWDANKLIESYKFTPAGW